MAGEVIGWGGEFKIGSAAATPVLTEVMFCNSLQLPQDTVEQIETTHLKSPNRRREYIAGMTDGGELVVEGNWIPGSATDIMLTAILGLDRAWEVTVPTSVGTVKKRVFTGSGAVIGYEKSAIVGDDKPTFTLTIKVSGAVTEAAGV